MRSPPLAPGVAAAREGREPELEKTLAAFESFRGRDLVVERAGGLHVPIDSKRDVIDLIALLKLPVLLVGRAGLGTINHVALSLEALKTRQILVDAVLLVRSREERDPSERDHARVIAERYGARVLGPVPFVTDDRKRQAAFRKALRPLIDR